MTKVKSIYVQPILQADAKKAVTQWHYSKKVDPRSQLHFGVFSQNVCHGVMQFGPSIDKHKTRPLISDTRWNGFLELNRMAFSDYLPKNTESRALSVAFKIIKKKYPFIEWIITYADGAQCGDGAIYRATGFWLTQIRKNKTMWKFQDGSVHSSLAFTIAGSTSLRRCYGWLPTDTWGSFTKRVGAKPIPGYQLRYIKPLHTIDPSRLNFEILPYSAINLIGAGMYRGKAKRAQSIEIDATTDQVVEGSENLTCALQLNNETNNV